MTRRLFEGLIWPAIAGNVAWSFFTVALAEPLSGDAIARLVVLIVLAAYLMTAWMRDRKSQNEALYYTLDGVFAIAVAVFAISTSTSALASKPYADWSLVAVFGVSAIGHALNGWDLGRPKHQRRLLFLVNFAGAALVLSVSYWAQDFVLWSRLAAVLVVLAALASVWHYAPEKQ